MIARIRFAVPLLALALPTSALASQASAELHGPDGKALGIVTLNEAPRGVLLRLDLRGIPPGGHGFHVHEKGTCTPDFGAAGDHYNPGDREHGFTNPAGHHAGDMWNVYAAADGTVRAEVLNRDITLGPGLRTVFDADGSALILHARPDSYRRDAEAGERIGCGVVRR